MVVPTLAFRRGSNAMRLSLMQLLVTGRPPEWPVAWVEDGRNSRLISWAEFHRRITNLAHDLALRPERNWLLACADPYDFAVALFAVWHAGRRALLPPSLREGAIAEVRDQADGMLDTLPASTDAPANVTLAPLDPARAGLDLFTSGSSGKPKRVAKSLAQLDVEIATLEQLWGDENPASEPVLATVPHHHIYGLLFRLLWPLSAGRPFDSETCAGIPARAPGPAGAGPRRLQSFATCAHARTDPAGKPGRARHANLLLGWRASRFHSRTLPECHQDDPSGNPRQHGNRRYRLAHPG
jgi:acyl-coenzyme A synthetase/AMP-(fatty) acid ligase